MDKQEKLIKAVNAELEEWLCSGDTDYLHKAMAVIRAEIDKAERKRITAIFVHGMDTK